MLCVPPQHTYRFPSRRGWGFCGYNCATSIKVKTGADTPGVLELEMSYKPFKGVTSDAMMWMFENLNGTVRSTVNNRTYPM